MIKVSIFQSLLPFYILSNRFHRKNFSLQAFTLSDVSIHSFLQLSLAQT